MNITLRREETVTNTDDIIDSRDVIKRIEELEESKKYRGGIIYELDELAALKALASEGSGYSQGWQHGTTLIRDTYFQEHAQELARDCGDIPSAGSSQWPLYYIDWEQAARELQYDYTSIDFDGVAYWVR